MDDITSPSTSESCGWDHSRVGLFCLTRVRGGVREPPYKGVGGLLLLAYHLPGCLSSITSVLKHRKGNVRGERHIKCQTNSTAEAHLERNGMFVLFPIKIYSSHKDRLQTCPTYCTVVGCVLVLRNLMLN